MPRPSHSLLMPVTRRPGVLWLALAWLLLAGLAWFAAPAQAEPVPAAHSELAYFGLADTGPQATAPAAGAVAQVPASCFKPLASGQAAAADLLLSEVGDQEALPPQPLLLATTPAVLVQGARPAVQGAGHRPLLRPPRTLG